MLPSLPFPRAVWSPLAVGMGGEGLLLQAPLWGSLVPSTRVASCVDHVSTAGQSENPTPTNRPSCENPLS